MSGFANAILGGAQKLIRKAIASPNYVTSTSGWSINKDGSAEFNDVVVRGEFDVGTLLQYVKIYIAPPPINGPAIVFNSDSATFSQTDGFIQAIAAGPGGAYGALFLSSPEAPGQTAAQITLTSGDGTNLRMAQVSGDLDVNGTLFIEPTAGNVVLQVDDTAAALAVQLQPAAGIQLPPGEYAKRGALALVPAASFQNGWTNYGNGYQAAGYIEFSDGTAGLTGVVTGGTTTSGTVIFALPANLKPAAHHVWDSPGTGGRHSQISVHSDGNVVIQTPDTGTTWVSLDPCRWPIAGF
ncbi:hypothetical protein [Actinomadura sp. NPDC048394]|uniref:hypothetical protein n=1 Tax=Actinomadura sp. NPDC048394 TaxID=3158223 RepID=UPI003405B1DA